MGLKQAGKRLAALFAVVGRYFQSKKASAALSSPKKAQLGKIFFDPFR